MSESLFMKYAFLDQGDCGYRAFESDRDGLKKCNVSHGD